jgi:hypothetical protein
MDHHDCPFALLAELEGTQMTGGYGYAVEFDMERHRAHRRRDGDLRRDERDPARHHLEDARPVTRAFFAAALEVRRPSE